MNTTLAATGDSGNPPDNSDSIAYETSRLVKASPGTLFGFAGFNPGAAQFVHLYDTTAIPADGSIPKFVYGVPAAGNFSFDWGVLGRKFTTGIVIGFSSIGPTKTLGTAGWISAGFK